MVRRTTEPVPGAERTLATDALHDALPDARLVVLALALTPDTRHIIGAGELGAMHERAWLVNVSRGGHVDTDALVDALERGVIAGAALDVTDPEPLPDGHRLWSMANCIITPHSAGSSGAVMRLPRRPGARQRTTPRRRGAAAGRDRPRRRLLTRARSVPPMQTGDVVADFELPDETGHRGA